MAHFHFCGVRQWSDDEITTLLNRSTKVFDDFLRPFEAAEKTFPDFFSFMRAADYTRFLPGDIPTKVDRATMAVSLEGRDPLLDHRIIEYASRLPSRIVSKDGISKYPLKKILYKYVPKDLVDRPKQGFTLPLDKWLKEDLKHLICDYLNEARIKRDGLLEWKTVECEINNFFSGRMTGASRLWFLFEFELWREKWLGRSG